MDNREYWPPATIAKFLEKLAFRKRQECSFDTLKGKQVILIPGMGAPVSQLFELVNALRSDDSFQEYGITAIELGLSLGDFSFTLETLIHKVEEELLSRAKVEQIVLFAHSHGGRFASELATYLKKAHTNLDLVVITAGTPIEVRPQSLTNWLISLAFRQWPKVNQPQLDMFFALYSKTDKIVNTERATVGSNATLIELEMFDHDDFRRPAKIVPELKRLCNRF